MTRCQIVIPARLASTRLPEKLLLKAGGKSVLQHTYEAACKVTAADGVIVAVDHERLADEVERFGGRSIMTSPDCASGTDRIAEVASALPDIDIFVNVQGDEPEIEPSAIELVAKTLDEHPSADIATIATPIRDPGRLDDPACVKIVMAPTDADATGHADAMGQGRAVYFSRSPVPHPRGGIDDVLLQAEPPHFWHHLGLYAYRRDFLDWFTNQPASPLEKIEGLEQLRALEAGKAIVVARVERAAPGIDTKGDFDAFQSRVEQNS